MQFPKSVGVVSEDTYTDRDEWVIIGDEGYDGDVSEHEGSGRIGVVITVLQVQ